jgi:O-antigen/teichoic acid export membrane protein
VKLIKEYKLFVQRIGLVGITNIFIGISSLILLPIMTKNFSISNYGIWVQINTTIALIPNLATLGLPYTMVRFLSAEKDKKIIQEGFYSISTIVLASTTIISALMFLFSKNIAVAIFNGDVNLAMLLSIIVFLACLNSLLLNFFRTFQQMKRYSGFLLIQSYLGVLIVSYFAISKYGIFITASGLLIANLITFIIMASFIILDIGFKLPEFKNFREYLYFGIPTIPSNLSSWIVDSSDRYLIGIFLGTAFVGYYSPGYTLGYMIIMILAPFSLLLPSLLPKYYEENEIEKVRLYLKYSMKYFLLIAIPTAFGLSILSKPILMILTTPEIALHGYLITPFTALSALFVGIYAIILNVIILKKKTKIMGIIWIIAATLNLGLNIIIIPYFGILGAAATTLLAYLIAFILTLSYSIKIFKFDFDLPFIFKSVISSVLMSIIILLIHPEGILNILITIILSSIIYILFLFIMKGIDKKEIRIIRKIINNN